MAETPQTTPSMVYVVIASSGEWSDRCEWVSAVYTDRTQAVDEATRRLREARADGALYHEWCRRRAAIIGTRYAQISDEDEADIVRQIGPCPEDGEADEFTVYEVPVGQWGRWDRFEIEAPK